jgi:hypothetical protein
MTTDSKSFEVFVSYSHKDKSLREKLQIHFATIEREGKVRLWHDRMIPPGNEWRTAIDDHLESADIILLLISPDFLASKYCAEIEGARAIARHDAKEARVVPILLRPSDWHTTPFARLQALPEDGKPVTTWGDRDSAFLNVAKGLRTLLAVMAESNPVPGGSRSAKKSPSSVSTHRLTVRILRDQGLLKELAEIFDSGASARSVLDELDFPRGHMPTFQVPAEFWEAACRELERGLVESGLENLLRAVAARYPHNPKFAAWRH